MKTCWRTRCCAAAIRVGEMKLMQGYVSDPRLNPFPQRPASAAVPWGQSNGSCDKAFPDRCTAPGYGGWPQPTSRGLCVDGCLFNLTADPTESDNLYGKPELSAQQTAIEARLAAAGKLAAPWAVVPELGGWAGIAGANAKLCDAAMHLGNLAPADLCGAGGCPPAAGGGARAHPL